MLKEGDKAPFVDAYEGQWLLLYFYPKDDTPGCTKEACAFRDHFKELGKRGVAIVGVSKDSETSHEKFREKYELPFDLIADTDLKWNKAYGAWQLKKFMGREYMGTARISYLIDPKGKIAKVYPKVKAAKHAEEVLQDMKDLV